MSVERKILKKGKDEKNLSKENRVIVNLNEYFYDEIKKENAYYRDKE